jgi:hypothetical protein
MEALHYAWHAFTAYCTGRWLALVYFEWRVKKEARERAGREEQRRVRDAAERLGFGQ